MDPSRLSKAVVDLAALVERLRGPQGCPWDAKQTDSTVKTYLLEEAYEVLDAVEDSSAGEVCSELGDLLFQILFLARLAEERREFDFVDVVEKITEKMVRRHPHVFGDKVVEEADEVARNWAEIKRSEKNGEKGPLSALYSVPRGLPALMRTHRLCERASKEGLEWSPRETGRIKKELRKKIEEIDLHPPDKEMVRFKEELGDVLFLLADLARRKGFSAEELLREANQRFLSRFEKAAY